MTELAFEPVVQDLPAAVLAGSRLWRLAGRLRRRHWVRWGSLRRTRPLSDQYGFDRGTPVDRVYIEEFLGRYATDVRGHVLEVRDSRYTFLYGRGDVADAEVVDIDASNADATLIADLAQPGSLPARHFDCAIVTQTLQYVDDPPTALANVRDSLKPGGVVLLTVPCAARIDPSFEGDRWRMTPAGLRHLVETVGGWDEVEVEGYGNVLASVAFLMGVAGEELREREVAERDGDFPLVACARARKSA